MSKKIILIITTLFFVISAEARPIICDTIVKAAKDQCSYFPWENALQVGPTFSYLSIENKQDTEYALEQQLFRGFVGGGKVGYQGFFANGLYAGVESECVAGKLEEENNQNLAKQVFASMNRVRLGYTYTALQGKKFQVTPYLGLGFRFLSQDGVAASMEDYKYYTMFLPVGFMVSYAIANSAYLGFHLEWFPDLDTTAEVSLRDLRYVLGKQREQLFVQIPAQFLLTDYLSCDIVPFWKQVKTRKWSLDSTTTQENQDIIAVIPEEKTVFWGANLFLTLLF